jgi:hypothetical protein
MRSAMLLLTGVVSAACLGPLYAQEPGEPEERTAVWFANHPAELARVLSACRDDPNAVRNSPDCINAERAAVLLEERRSQPPE